MEYKKVKDDEEGEEGEIRHEAVSRREEEKETVEGKRGGNAKRP